MRTIHILFLQLLLTMAGCQGTPPAGTNTFQPSFNFLTTGDAAAGRQAFSDLKCGTCHRVSGASTLQSLRLSGPDLGSLQSTRSANEIADSLVVPSHVISTPPGHENSVSPMGDYTMVMTVRQLTDLVAFIKALPE